MNKIIITVLAVSAIVVLILSANKNLTTRPLATLTPSPEPSFNPFPYKAPAIPAKRAYLTYIVGDSIVAALGANAEGLRQDLLSYYPDHEFVNYNYGFASTNILSLEHRLNQETVFNGTSYPAILKQGFDLIIIESFAYNPPFEFSKEEALQKYEEILETNLRQIIKTHPDAVVALMTPIAPNKENFAKYTYNLSPEKRKEWVAERVSYIEKVKSYAAEKQIPLIDVYSRSQDEKGDGLLKYIDPHDYIHPSKEGVKLIEQTIADFIYQNKIFPE